MYDAANTYLVPDFDPDDTGSPPSNPLRLLRSELPPEDPSAREPTGRALTVLTCHGWAEADRDAAALLATLGGAVRLVVAQNQLEGAEPCRAWCRDSGVACAVVRDPSFAAANRAGVAVLRPRAEDWLVFTQADVVAGVGAVAAAQRVAVRRQGTDRYPPCVGVSGGELRGWPGDGPLVVAECGRNVRSWRPGVQPVDFVTGYWVVVRADAYAASGGWDAGYSLYHEDCDLGLRLASVGCRSVVVPDLPVEHRRGETIRREVGADGRQYVQVQTRRRFLERWEARCRVPYTG